MTNTCDPLQEKFLNYDVFQFTDWGGHGFNLISHVPWRGSARYKMGRLCDDCHFHFGKPSIFVSLPTYTVVVISKEQLNYIWHAFAIVMLIITGTPETQFFMQSAEV